MSSTSKNHNFEKLRMELNLTNRDFSELIGVNETLYSKIKRGVYPFGDKTINKIRNAFPEYNIDWILYNKGEKYKSKNETIKILSKDIDDYNKAIEKENVSTIPKDGFIPVLDVDFTAGFTFQNLANYARPDVLGYVKFPELIGSTHIVRAKGNSMSPHINDRDFVGIRIVNNRNIIDYGNTYGITTDDLAVFKRIKKGSTPETITLESNNLEYEPYEIERKEVNDLYIVVGAISIKSINF